MPPKKKRADRKIIEKIFKEGSFINSPVFSFKFILFKNKKDSQISFVVPKSVLKLATKRNKLRRLGYRALKKEANRFSSGLAGVFIFKKNEDKIFVLENEIKTIFNKVH
jgi:ribonuclease P protein component